VTCPLCDLEKKTHWYHENESFVVCECLSCEVPMYVWKSHVLVPTVVEQRTMYDDAKKRFPDRKIDLVRRGVPDHFHFHCR